MKGPRIGRSGWKRALPLLLVLGVALAVAGYAYSSGSPNAQLKGQDRVYGGGQFTGADGTSTRSFAIDAHAQAGGQAAYGDIEYGGGIHYQHEQVTCLAISGNQATIGAIVTQADRPIVGYWAVMVLTDNGPITSATPDETTLQGFGPADDPSWPAGFPYVCPSPSEAAALVPGDFPLDGGAVVVQDASH